MHKKYHKKFKILDILAVTTQAREGIETVLFRQLLQSLQVTTQVREGIDTQLCGELGTWYPYNFLTIFLKK